MARAPRRGDSLPEGHPNKGETYDHYSDHGLGFNRDDRPTRDRTLLDVALVMAKRGTCSRAHVGAVIARGGRIITTGYNGAPAGMPHCDHTAEPPRINLGEGLPEYEPPVHNQVIQLPLDSGATITPSGCTTAEHAERNAIAYAARYGLGTDGSTLYSTHAPCVDCARAIINAGILRVVYLIPYRLTEGLELLGLAGVEITHHEMS